MKINTLIKSSKSPFYNILNNNTCALFFTPSLLRETSLVLSYGACLVAYKHLNQAPKWKIILIINKYFHTPYSGSQKIYHAHTHTHTLFDVFLPHTHVSHDTTFASCEPRNAMKNPCYNNIIKQSLLSYRSFNRFNPIFVYKSTRVCTHRKIDNTTHNL